MPRAKKRCGLKCPNPVFRYGKCKIHQPDRIPWVKTEESPDRSYLKTADWQRQRKRVLWRDNNGHNPSGITGCQGRWVEGCTEEATTVDHKLGVWYSRADEVDDEDLQGLCAPCHNFKSSRDGYFAKILKKRNS